MTNNPQAQITNLYASYFCIHNYEIIISSSKTAPPPYRHQLLPWLLLQLPLQLLPTRIWLEHRYTHAIIASSSQRTRSFLMSICASMPLVNLSLLSAACALSALRRAKLLLCMPNSIRPTSSSAALVRWPSRNGRCLLSTSKCIRVLPHRRYRPSSQLARTWTPRSSFKRPLMRHWAIACLLRQLLWWQPPSRRTTYASSRAAFAHWLSSRRHTTTTTWRPTDVTRRQLRPEPLP